mgnify:CR=1 FL=1|tara:strand:- start:949 stop:1554 length:606 start_codon:yes stop_codon:yes gene_type:complete
MKLLPINSIKGNANNPRLIKNDKYRQQLKSIKDTPQMMNLRPVIIDEDNVILGGHQRWRACKELGWKEIPTESYTEAIHKTTKSWIEDKISYEDLCKEIAIKDNTHYGEYDYDILANEWDALPLDDWGVNVWQPEEDVDYSILESLDLGDTLNDKEAGVKRAIQIEFDPEHYDQALLLINQARKDLKNVGLIVLEAFRNER